MTIKQQGGIFGRNPTFNDLTVEGSVNIDGGVIDNTVIGGSTPAAISGTTGTFSGNLAVNTDTLFVNTSSDKIGVGTVSPSGDGETIHINGSTANSTLHLTNSTTGSGAGDGTYVTTSGNDFLIRNREAGSTIIYSNNTPRVTIDSGGDVAINTGNVVMANGKGIDFSATAGTGTSELFDDYEEGAWTPILTTDGTDFDDVDYNSNRSGYYRKIGNAVFITGYMRTNSTTVGSATGNVLIAGLPYTSASTNRTALSVTAAENWAGEEPLSLALFGNSTSMGVRYRAGVTTTDLETQAADVGTNNILIFSGIYFT